MALPQFAPIQGEHQHWINQQLEASRHFVDAFSPQDIGQPISLAALDRAFAAWLSQGSQDIAEVNGAINVVGIRFGQYLVDEAGFEWVIASDDYGTEIAVRALPRRGDVLVYPANFVAKRWESKSTEFLAYSFTVIKQQVARVAAKRPG